MLFTMLLVVLAIFLVGGIIGHRRFGYFGWSPAGVILAVLGILYFTHHLSGHISLH